MSLGDVAGVQQMKEENKWWEESMFFSLCTASVCLTVSLAGLAASPPK